MKGQKGHVLVIGTEGTYVKENYSFCDSRS
jgi:hypothetical protein